MTKTGEYAQPVVLRHIVARDSVCVCMTRDVEVEMEVEDRDVLERELWRPEEQRICFESRITKDCALDAASQCCILALPQSNAWFMEHGVWVGPEEWYISCIWTGVAGLS